MQKEEIISGIKQAIERGSSLEKAKSSFINAGYSSQDVEDSSKVFLGVSGSMPQQHYQPQEKLPTPPQASPNFPTQVTQQNKMQPIALPAQPPANSQIKASPKGKAMRVFIILLSIVLLILILFLAATVFYKEQVKEFLGPIFPSWISTEIFIGLI